MRLEKEALKLGVSFINYKTKNRKLFKSRLAGHRIYYVYIWRFLDMLIYYGSGTCLRAICHENDMLSKFIERNRKNMILEIIANNLTDFESRMLEADLINNSKKKLTKYGAFKWDGESLLNKRHEYRRNGVYYEGIFKEIVNDNYWETIRGKIHDN